MKSFTAIAAILALIGSSMPVSAQASSGTLSWSDIRHLGPGTPVFVTRDEPPNGVWYLIRTTDTEGLLVDLNRPELPGATRDLLKEAARSQPGSYASVADGGVVILRNDTSIQPSGIFVGNKKVADFSSIIHRIERADIEGGRATMNTEQHSHKGLYIGLSIVGGLAILAAAFGQR